jgi:exopolysaccharide biosynthesis WecB/TagA/CpsF family protein
MSHKTVLFGLGFDAITRRESLKKISDLIAMGQQQKTSHYVATVNLDFITTAFGHVKNRVHHPELYQCLCHADLTIADGMPMVWWSRFVGAPLPERVTGADLVPDLCQVASQKSWRVYFLGSNVVQLAHARDILLKKNPNLNIVGMESPMIHTEGKGLANTQEEDRDVIYRIHEAKPDLLFLCLGCPKQEMFYQRLKQRVHIPLTIGVGGALSFITEDLVRAPIWMQKTGLEWAFRFSQEPTRLFKRYFNDGCFFLQNSYHLARYRRSCPKISSQHWSHIDFERKNKICRVIKAPQVADRPDSQLFNPQYQTIVDFRQCDFLSHQALSIIYEQLQISHQHLNFIRIGKNLKKSLKAIRCWDLFAPHVISNEIFGLGDHTWSIQSQGKNHRLAHLGEINDKSRRDFKGMIEQLIQPGDHVHMSFDYIQNFEHCFVAQLMQLQQKLKSQGGSFVICDLNLHHRQTLHSLKCSTEFSIDSNTPSEHHQQHSAGGSFVA